MPRNDKSVPFLFLPGDHLDLMVGAPGPDLMDFEVLRDDGGQTVHGLLTDWSGNVSKHDADRKSLIWQRGDAVSVRFHQWMAGQP